jgi:hypothetical protein
VGIPAGGATMEIMDAPRDVSNKKFLIEHPNFRFAGAAAIDQRPIS